MSQPTNSTPIPYPEIVAVLKAIDALTPDDALELGIALFREWRLTGQTSIAVTVDALATELGLYVTARDNAFARLQAVRDVRMTASHTVSGHPTEYDTVQ
jgi:hypothetical protein